jgi:hypothetical protein
MGRLRNTLGILVVSIGALHGIDSFAGGDKNTGALADKIAAINNMQQLCSLVYNYETMAGPQLAITKFFGEALNSSNNDNPILDALGAKGLPELEKRSNRVGQLTIENMQKNLAAIKPDCDKGLLMTTDTPNVAAFSNKLVAKIGIAINKAQIEARRQELVERQAVPPKQEISNGPPEKRELTRVQQEYCSHYPTEYLCLAWQYPVLSGNNR